MYPSPTTGSNELKPRLFVGNTRRYIQSMNSFEANSAPLFSRSFRLLCCLSVPRRHPMRLQVTWSSYVNVCLYASSMFALITVGLREIWGGPRPRLTLSPAQTHPGMLFMFSTPSPSFSLPLHASLPNFCLCSFSPAASHFLDILTLFLLTFFFRTFSPDKTLNLPPIFHLHVLSEGP